MLPVINARITGNIFLFKIGFQSDRSDYSIFSVNPYGKLYFQRNSRRALQTTVTELNAIAAAPATGLNCQWNQ